MDLNSVKRSIKSGAYATLEEAVADLSLIWDNCRTYNMINSVRTSQPITHQADVMERYMRSFCQKIKIPCEIREKRPREEPLRDANEVSMEEKLELSDKVKRMSSKALVSIVETTKQLCPSAVYEIDSDRLQVKLDDLDRNTLRELLRLANAALNEGTGEPVKRLKEEEVELDNP
jgi:hypothetical protein